MVGSMTKAICPSCGHSFSPYIDSGVDLQVFCNQRGIPYLADIPFLPDEMSLKSNFDNLTQKVVEAKPLEIWQKSFEQRLGEAAIKTMIKKIIASN